MHIAISDIWDTPIGLHINRRTYELNLTKAVELRQMNAKLTPSGIECISHIFWSHKPVPKLSGPRPKAARASTLGLTTNHIEYCVENNILRKIFGTYKFYRS
jgi:hypothetical protein